MSAKAKAADSFGATVQQLIGWGVWEKNQSVSDLGFPPCDQLQVAKGAGCQSIAPRMTELDYSALAISRAIHELRGDLRFCHMTMLCFLRDKATEAGSGRRVAGEDVLRVMVDEPDCRDQSLGFFLLQFYVYTQPAELAWWAKQLGLTVSQMTAVHDAGVLRLMHLLDASSKRRAVLPFDFFC